MNLAHHPIQAAYARLLLARALEKSGRAREAHKHYLKILLLPSQVSDEYGIPLSLYAAGRLLQDGVAHQAILERIGTELETRSLLSPIESYMLRGLAETLVKTGPEANIREAAQNIHEKILEHISYLEQAMALQKDFPNLIPMANRGSEPENREPVWMPYGDETWLVTLAPPVTGSQTWALAVQAKEIFSSLAAEGRLSKTFPGEIHFVTDRASEGQSLGQNFPGLKAAFIAKENPALTGKWNLQGYFYLLTLLLVLSVTLFGSYLLWRDVRREVRLAEMRSQFVSSVSHELKTPLTAIRMFAETLRMGRSQNPPTQSEYLETIVGESERLTRLLNNVLDFSKIEQGKKIYRPKPTSLAGIVQAAARTMQYPLAQQGFDLRMEVEDGMPPVQVDRDAIEQAILNLLTNAMKYSGESREIDLRLRRQDDQALIQVTDRGLGVDPKEQARIFEKFYRAPTPENQLVPGTGLGLALVAHTAKAHGGHVEVQSAPGKGSTFSIYLPLESQA
ncbi:MAG: sensor histidine kinase [Acidobacteriota bacterium]